MSEYIESSLSDGETIIAIFKHHWTMWISFWFFVLISPILLGSTLPVALLLYFHLKGWERGITNKRVVTKKGIISRRTDEMRLGSIETVELNQSIMGRLLNFGEIKLTGRGVSDMVMPGLDDPTTVKKAIESSLPY